MCPHPMQEGRFFNIFTSRRTNSFWSLYTIYYIFGFLTNLHLKMIKHKKAGTPQKTSWFYRQAPTVMASSSFCVG